ncbi:hypothetical protein Hanom_Chr12g01147981 [Helianthus anomalus]
MTKTYHISMVHVSIKYHIIVFMYKDCFVHCIKNKFKCSFNSKTCYTPKSGKHKKGLRVYSQNCICFPIIQCDEVDEVGRLNA